MATGNDDIERLDEGSSKQVESDLKVVEEAMGGIHIDSVNNTEPLGDDPSKGNGSELKVSAKVACGKKKCSKGAAYGRSISEQKLHWKSISTTKDIKHCYDMKEWTSGEQFTCRVGFIFDLSKFYIVTLHQEASALQNYINTCYKRDPELYSIPSSDVQPNMYCIVYTDGAYYRAYIPRIPEVRSVVPRAVVHLIDFGYTVLVTFDCLFYMSDDLYTVPKFAIRALLSGVQPYESAMWSYKAFKRFEELTVGEVLTGLLTANHVAQKTLYVKLYRQDKLVYAINVGEAILKEKLASPIVKTEDKIGSTSDNERKAGVFVSKLRFPFLFPSHQAIEGGAVPYDLVSFKVLTECPGSENLLWPYLHYIPTKNVFLAKFNKE